MSEQPPITEEQLALFSEQTAHIVRHKLRTYVRTATVGFLVLAAGVGFSIYSTAHEGEARRVAIVDSGRAVVVDSCNRDFKATLRLRGIFQRLIVVTDKQVKSGRQTAQEGADAISFYQNELNQIPLPDCRRPQTVLTDNPDAPVRTPTPLYPKK